MFAKYTKNWVAQNPQSEWERDRREHLLSTLCILEWVRGDNGGASWEHKEAAWVLCPAPVQRR